MISKIAALSALISCTAAVGASDEEHKRALSAFFEDPDVSPLDHKNLLQRAFRSTHLQADSLLFEGTPRVVPALGRRVKMHNPPCGNGGLPPSQQLGQALMGGGGLMVASSTLGGPGAPFMAAAGAALAGIGMLLDDGTQPNANCALACSAVPGHYERDALAKIANVNYTYTNFRGAQSALPMGAAGEYFYASDWVTEKSTLVLPSSPKNHEATQAILVKRGTELVSSDAGADGLKCPITLVCSQAKNWATGGSQALKVSVGIDIRQVADGACLNATMLNKERYATKLTPILKPEWLQTYGKKLGQELAEDGKGVGSTPP